MFIRYQGTTADDRGVFPGIFKLVNGLAKAGKLTAQQEAFRRENNDWYDAAYTNPTDVDPSTYDWNHNPGAVAWFKPTATHLLARVDGYLEILSTHNVPYERLESDTPGKIVYEDAHQVIAVPR
ncbi:hypothetical protein ACFWY9_31605 [Amycolatopsis sp. NPDC059027]|uniref:hypothetical protein n=1 Tax=unclassified Amycolatopsis TaxID=2618356 RepID=UPI00366B28A2